MNVRSSWILFFASLLLVSVLSGCGAEDASTTGSGEIKRLGAVLPMFDHPFFVAQKRGLEEKAAELGIEIDVRDGKDDDAEQLDQVENLITLGVDAIILCPRDADAAVRSVEAANRAGVPILTMNRAVNGGEVIAYVGADDAEGGRKQAEVLVHLLGPEGGRIIYLQGTLGSSPQRSRERGFLEGLGGTTDAIEIVEDRDTDFQESTARDVMTDLVQSYDPGQIDAIIAQADELAVPAAEVARQAGWAEDLIVIGFNGNITAFQAIRDGFLSATILQDAAQQARIAVEQTIAHLDGEYVPDVVYTPLPLITPETIAEYEPAY